CCVTHWLILSWYFHFFLLLLPRPPRSPLFPYTTLFRSLPGQPYRPPLRHAFDLVRRGGFMPARAAPPELPGFRFTTFGGSTAGIEGVFGRIYNPPLHARATISCCGGVQNTYSLSQKNPTCICKSVFLCWRYLSSRAVTRKVLSAKVSLTSVFGMGTGG